MMTRTRAKLWMARASLTSWPRQPPRSAWYALSSLWWRSCVVCRDLPSLAGTLLKSCVRALGDDLLRCLCSVQHVPLWHHNVPGKGKGRLVSS